MQYLTYRIAMLLGCLVLLPVARPTARAADAVENSGSAETGEKNWHLLEPLWTSPVVDRESVLFIQEADAAPNARLALTPTRIKQIARADGSQIFTDEDYTVMPPRDGSLSPRTRGFLI